MKGARALYQVWAERTLGTPSPPNMPRLKDVMARCGCEWWSTNKQSGDANIRVIKLSRTHVTPFWTLDRRGTVIPLARRATGSASTESNPLLYLQSSSFISRWWPTPTPPPATHDSHHHPTAIHHVHDRHDLILVSSRPRSRYSRIHTVIMANDEYDVCRFSPHLTLCASAFTNLSLRPVPFQRSVAPFPPTSPTDALCVADRPTPLFGQLANLLVLTFPRCCD